MAEIDIKDLGDAAAIADTDEILAIVNGLGKNLNWAKLKEQLARELPEATKNSKGFLSYSLFDTLNRLNIRFSDGSGASISCSKGIYLIVAYQKSDMGNFCIYIVVKPHGKNPVIHTLSSHILGTGAYNDLGTIVINGADQYDIAQVAFGINDSLV